MWDGKSSDISAGSVNGENGAVAEREPEVVSTEQVTESSAAPEVRFYSPGEGATDVDGNYLVEPSDSEQAALTQIAVSFEGESNGSVDFNSSTDVQIVSEANKGKNVDDRGGIELNQIKFVESTTSTDQGTQESANSEVDSANSEVDDVDHGNGVFLTREDTMEENKNNGNMSDSEDAGKEEMFVDAPDQLTVGRTPDLEESMIVIEAPETEDREYDHIQSSPHSSTVMEDKLKVHQLIDELGLVRSELDRTLREKELMAKENKVHEEEREKFVKELSTLHSQLLALSSQQALLGENGDGFVNRLRHAEELEGSTGSEIPLHGMFSDCSMFVSHLKTTIDEQLQTESTTRELHGIVFVKEQEIEELHTKVTDLSVSQDVFSSYIASVHQEYASTQRELFQQKIKELDFVAKLNKLEERNQKLLEDLDKANERANVATAEASKTKLELEQTESKLANSREKLTMAVTKGKALVQQRDSLRLSLNEKTSELEKCLLELQQQSEALESAEARYEELLRTRDLVVSLQKSLSERESILKEIEETISQVNTSEEIESLEVLGKIRWLVDQKSIGEAIVLENHKLRDALSAICLPEKVSSSDLESQIEWLGKSLVQAKDDLNRLLDKVVESQEAIASRESQLSKAHKDIDNLTATLLSEKEEKDLLQTRLEDLTRKYDVLTEQLSHVSSEKDVVGKKLLEVVGSHVNDDGTLDDSAADTGLIVDKCITMLEERSKNLEDLKEKYEVLTEKSTQVSSEKDRLMKMLLEVSGSTMADHGCNGPPTDTDMLIEACFGRITERNRMLEDVTRKYEELFDKSNQSSSVKDVLLQKLIDVSGFHSDDQCPDDYSAEVDVLIEKFIGKIRDRISASESSIDEKEQFQRLQCLLYLSMQDLMLFELIAEEDCFDRSEIERLSTELSRVSEEIVTLKIERDSLHKDLERADEKVSILREKLSLAVKKGKGLMQDRDGLKLSMDEKNKEIERLKEEIQQQESALNECKDQIKSLRSDLELIPKLESDIVNAEQFLSERTNALQRLIESIEGLVLPKETSNDVVFEDPVEKVKWLQEFIQESHLGRAFVEQELQKAKEEAELLAVKLEESHVTIRSQQDALSQAERSILVFGDEMQDLEAVKISLEQELGKEKTDKVLLDGRLMDANKSINTLQDTLGLIEKEVQNAKEEAYLLAEKLKESNVTIRSLEDALSQAQRTVSSLDEEKKKIEAARISAEEELERGKADSVLLAGKLADAHETIKSLEDSLLQAENNVSLLKNVKNEAELQSKQEIMSLNAKLAACMEELEGTHGRIENQSSELIDQLRHLHMLVTNNDLLSALDKEFQRKHEGLRNLSLLLQDIQEQFGERSRLQNRPDIESYLHMAKPEFGDNLNHSVDNSERSAEDISESISSYIPKVLEGFLVQNKLLTGKFECFSSYMDEHVGVLSQALQATRNEVVRLLGVMESLKLNMKNFEASNQGQENKITMLHNNVEVLYAACSNAIQELQTLCKVLDSNFSAGLDSLDLEIRGGDNAPEEQLECIKAAEKLSVVVKHMQAKAEEFMTARTVWLTISEELRDELRHTKLAAENARKEKELSCERVHNLEEDLDALQISCREMKLKLEDYQVKEDKLREKEQELPLQYQTSLATDQEVEEHLLSKSELEMLCSKVNKMEVQMGQFEVNKMEVQMGQSEVWSPEMQSPGVADKIFYIMDNFALLQNGVNSLASDKEKLQSSLAAQYVEIEHLKSEIESFTFIKQDVEMKNNELAELAQGLERIIGTLGGSDNFEDKKISGVKGQIPVLEELAMGLILEAESSKAKTQEMGTKLQGSQNLVNELSAKVKLLEEAVHERQVASDTIQERSIYETPSILGSEISEVEDEGQVGIANKIPPVLPSAHVRTMRKASSDHLAIDINSESDRLLNHHEVDDDKGHVFKSLNSSGFIPKQGKSIADRVDGIWVAGGRLLVSRPGARMGLIAYWLLLHIWVLGSIL